MLAECTTMLQGRYGQQLVLIAWSGRGANKKKLKPFLESSYSYMPLVWGATLAFWLGPALQEGGHILPVSLLLFAPLAFTCRLLSSYCQQVLWLADWLHKQSTYGVTL